MKTTMQQKNNSKLPDGWRFSTASSFEGVEAIRPIWEQMQAGESSPAINADIDRYISVIKAAKIQVQPHVIILYHDDNPIAMIAARIETHNIKMKLGYKTLFNPRLNCLYVVNGGVLGEPDSDISELLFYELMEQLKTHNLSAVYFNRLKVDSHLYELAGKLTGFLNRGYFPTFEKHWIVSVPETMESFYKKLSQRHRNNLKRYKRRLEKEFSQNLKIVIYSRQSDLDIAIKDAARISRTTYQYGLGKGFYDDKRNRALLTTAAEKGWLRIHILYINDEPCAFELWFRYKNVYHGCGVGFDPKWSKWRIGTMLLLDTIERLCNDPDIDTIDFGFGDAEYKQSYGDKVWTEASMYIFAPRIYPVTINVLRIIIGVFNLGLKYIVNKLGFTNKVKRWWRNRLNNRTLNNVL